MTDPANDPKSGSPSGPGVPRAARVLELVTGYIVARCVSAAAKLRLSDLLVKGPMTTEQLAAATGTHAPSLYRMMRVLVSYDFYTEPEPGRFGLAALGECLRSDVPDSMRSWAEMNMGPIPGTFANMMESLRTGLPVFEKTYGMSHYEYLSRHPDEGRAFNDAMADYSRQITAQLMEAYDFGRFGTLVDVGGGPGMLLSAILRKNPAARGVLLDLPRIAEQARARMAEAGLADRCQAIGGDFLQEVPAGGDAYILSLILHNWDDERCVTLLKNVRRAMKPDATVLLIDMMIPPGPGRHFGKDSDMVMLVVMGGRERSAAEYGQLFEKAGLTLTRVVPTPGTLSVVEAVAV